MTPLMPKKEVGNIFESYFQEEMIFDMLSNQRFSTARIIGITTKKFLLSFIPAFIIEIADNTNIILFYRQKTLVFVKEEERRDNLVKKETAERKELDNASNKIGIKLEKYHNSIANYEKEKGNLKEETEKIGKEIDLEEFPLPREYFLALGIWGKRYVVDIIKKDVYTKFESYLGNFWLTGYDWIIIFGKEENRGYRTKNQIEQIKEKMRYDLQLQEYPKFEDQIINTIENNKNNVEIIELIAKIEEKFKIIKNYQFKRKKWTLNEITRKKVGELLKGRKKEKEIRWLLGKPVFTQGNIILFKQEEKILLLDSDDLIGKEYLTMET